MVGTTVPVRIWIVPICTVPLTERALLPGLFVLMPTPPAARMRNWLFVVLPKSSNCESAQTKVPTLVALAWVPAANECSVATLLCPPGIVA